MSRQRPAGSGTFDLVGCQALIDIEKQPALLVHLVGVGKPDGQVADKRAQHRVGLAEPPHGGGINDVDHRVGGRDRPRGAFTLAGIEAISPNSSPAFSVASTSPSRETISTEPEWIR